MRLACGGRDTSMWGAARSADALSAHFYSPPTRPICGADSGFYSTVDADGDGVDDQTDVLDNALAYVDTRPKYKSRYYQTGYPDDGYGACTDVVAFALKNAGYDLQALVDADIREHPQWYDIRQPDANIDFRRVRNLKVFLRIMRLYGPRMCPGPRNGRAGIL